MAGLLRGIATAAVLATVLGVSPAVGVEHISSTWRDGNLHFYDVVAGPLAGKSHCIAPVVFYDDFLGALPLSANDTNNGWTIVDVGNATEASSDAENGIARLALTATNQAQDAVLYWGDQRGIAVDQGGIFECYAALAVVPGSATTVVWGLAGNHNLAKDNVTEGAWFRCQGSAAALCESDDTTNNNDDKATGTTMVAGTYYNFKIDFTTIADVKFYINGTQVATGTTFDMSNLTSSEAVMQPYFSLDKASGTGAGTLDVDWVVVSSKRQ